MFAPAAIVLEAIVILYESAANISRLVALAMSAIVERTVEPLANVAASLVAKALVQVSPTPLPAVHAVLLTTS